MKLVEEFVINAELGRPLLAGAIAGGMRIVAPICRRNRDRFP
ncbi:MAG: hypothetical protein OER95_04525 [Acidimicrobiia bacterium]|nr:hypothetical protein [Acidimicrobiia bacterium]